MTSFEKPQASSEMCIYLSHHKMILFFQKAFQKTNTPTCLSSPPNTNSFLPEKILMYRRAAVALNCYFLAKNNYCKFLGIYQNMCAQIGTFL